MQGGHDPCLGRCVATTAQEMWPRGTLALTSAGPAPSADAECHGAVPSHGAGLEHCLHVLVLGSILSILQALGLALAGRGAAGELAGLREEKDLLFQLRTA